jgi:hypothetical protein
MSPGIRSQASNIHGEGFMHGAGQRCVSIEVERDLAEIDTAPVRQMAAVKAQADDRTPVRVSRQAGVLQRQRLKGDLFGVVYRQRVPFSPIGREFTSKPLTIRICSFISRQSGVNSTTDIDGMVRR